jgi:ribose/xylose/arabinose/galactoside ABC-type transport system permease subunit
MGGASILGGKGSALGAFLGVLTLGVLINGMRLLSVFTYNQLAIQALLFITVVAVDAFYVNKVKNRIIKSKF